MKQSASDKFLVDVHLVIQAVKSSKWRHHWQNPFQLTNNPNKASCTPVSSVRSLFDESIRTIIFCSDSVFTHFIHHQLDCVQGDAMNQAKHSLNPSDVHANTWKMTITVLATDLNNASFSIWQQSTSALKNKLSKINACTFAHLLHQVSFQVKPHILGATASWLICNRQGYNDTDASPNEVPTPCST